MDYLNRDINTLSKNALREILGVSERAVEHILKRREEEPFLELSQLLEIPGVSERLVRRIEKKQLLNFGPPANTVEDSLEGFPKPYIYLTDISDTGPGGGVPKGFGKLDDGLSDVFFGLGRLFDGLGKVYLQQAGDPGGGEDEAAALGPLPPLREGQHRHLSDALVKVLRAEYGFTHAPPDDFLGPGPLGYRWHFYEVTPPAFCAFVWILKGRIVNGRRVGSSPLARGSAGTGVVQSPTADARDEVIQDVHESNTIFSQCQFQFGICGVNVLDVDQMEDMHGANLADQLFTNSGVLYGSGNPGGTDPLSSLYTSLQITQGIAFNEHCLHLFYVSDVQDSPQKPDTNKSWVSGVGGSRQARPGTDKTPMGIIEGGGATMAHEIAHGLGEPHSDRPGSRRPGEPAFDATSPLDQANLLREVPSGTRISSYQCEKMKEWIRDNHLVRACP